MVQVMVLTLAAAAAKTAKMNVPNVSKQINQKILSFYYIQLLWAATWVGAARSIFDVQA